MELWWTSLDLYLKIMWGIAIPASIVFIIQMIMTFVGMDADGDAGGDVSADDSGHAPFQLFTFRNFINFLLGFSWAGISFYGIIGSAFWLTVFSAFAGALLVAIVMAIFFGLSRITQSGNIDVNDAVGHTATVYYTVPAARKGAGKIQITIQQAVREYDALTDGDAIPTGRMVRVKALIDSHTLLVEPV